MYTLQELTQAMLPQYAQGLNPIAAAWEIRYAIVAQLRAQGRNARMHPEGVYINGPVRVLDGANR